MTRSRLMLGDCLERMSEIPDNSIDMVLADPPYGTTQCKWDSVIPLAPMWAQLRRIVKRDAAIVMTAVQPFSSSLVMSAPSLFKQALVWRKNKPSGHLNAKKRHLTAHEDILIFCQGVLPYWPQKTTGHKPANYAHRVNFTPVYGAQVPTKYPGGNTDRYPVSVLDFPVVNNDGSSGPRLHESQKPVELMEYLIKTFTEECALVLDFAMGSGTTGVACANTGRDFVGIELLPKYYEPALLRVNAARQDGLAKCA